jgi:type II secretory pathway pseudopilin PulG
MNRMTASMKRGQRGAVLIVSLILLVVLTLLGVSVMNMTQLEERMASNSQEVVQAFQSAETGLQRAYNDVRDWDLAAPMTSTNSTNPSGIGRLDQSTYKIEFIVSHDAPPGSGFDPAKFEIVNFDLFSQGTAESNFSSDLHGGAFRMRTKGGGYLD